MPENFENLADMADRKCACLGNPWEIPEIDIIWRSWLVML